MTLQISQLALGGDAEDFGDAVGTTSGDAFPIQRECTVEHFIVELAKYGCKFVFVLKVRIYFKT